ncbi:putative phytanoyl-CoA dioxygenase [Sycon ciliatum]|uniref:putative phytanoyl-CoA dioxygenase n=1 Tax=Sycon ciliatum TaxID=27933 RepID=UPI0031F6867C
MGAAESSSTTACEVERPPAKPFDPAAVYVAPKVDIPLDEDDTRYVKSFSIDQKEEFQSFFEEYGFVVIRDVLSRDECEASVDDIWKYLEGRGYRYREWDGPTEHEKLYGKHPQDEERPEDLIRRDDPSTWNNDWPPLANAGILGFLPVFTKQALLNRQNANIYSVYTTLMKRKDLMVSQDRYGLFRPVKVAGDPEKTNDKWRTSYSLHWDLNPWRHSLRDGHFEQGAVNVKDAMSKITYEDPGHFFEENNEVGTADDDRVNLQGLINFADNLVEDGGFQTVVGFHKHIVQWAETTKDSMGLRMMDRSFVPIDCEDPLYKQAQRVSMRAGSIVVWDQRMAHGSAPNSSSNLRFCQFMKMFPALDLDTTQAKNRAKVVQGKVDLASVELSDVGKCLFGLKPWQ